MGYTTVVSFKNDAFRHLEENEKQIVENLKNGALTIGSKTKDYRVGNHFSAMTVAQSVHADKPTLYFLYQYELNEVGSINSNLSLEERKRNLEIMKEIIERESNIIKELEKNE